MRCFMLLPIPLPGHSADQSHIIVLVTCVGTGGIWLTTHSSYNRHTNFLCDDITLMKRCKVVVDDGGARHIEEHYRPTFWLVALCKVAHNTSHATVHRCSILDDNKATVLDQIVHVRLFPV